MNWRSQHYLGPKSVGVVPCCGEVAVTVECRLVSSYGTKCGYVPPPYALDAVRRYFRTVSATITSEVQGTNVYAHPEEHANQQGSVSCTYAFSASCADPFGSWAANYEIDMEEYGTGSGSGGGGGATDSGRPEGGATICITLSDAWEGLTPPWYSGFSHFSVPEVLTPFPEAVRGADDGDCQRWYILAASTPWTDTESDTIDAGTLNEYTYTETASITADISLCDEHTTEELISVVELDAEPGEWMEGPIGCCAHRILSSQEATYEYAALELRFFYDPPCAGRVRVHYRLTTTQVGGEPVVEEAYVDDPLGDIVPIEMPLLPDSGVRSISRCVSDVRAEVISA